MPRWRYVTPQVSGTRLARGLATSTASIVTPSQRRSAAEAICRRSTDLTRTIPWIATGPCQRLLPRVVAVPGLTPQQSGAILLLYDVTELARLDEMRSELVAVASHELQTPLTTLRMTLADAAGGGSVGFPRASASSSRRHSSGSNS